MSPENIGWILSASGAIIFILLGYFIRGLRPSLPRNTASLSPTQEKEGELIELLKAAEARVEMLERTIAEEREKQLKSAAESQMAGTSGDAIEARVEALEIALKEERKLASERERLAKSGAAAQMTRLAREATASMKQKVVDLEEALKQEKSAAGETQDQIAALENTLEKMKQELAHAQSDLDREQQRSQELESSHNQLKEELKEEREATQKAIDQWRVLQGQLEGLKSDNVPDKRKNRESELAKKVRVVAERTWPEYDKTAPSTSPPPSEIDKNDG